jgi:hypothetical protein
MEDLGMFYKSSLLLRIGILNKVTDGPYSVQSDQSDVKYGLYHFTAVSI